MAIAPFAASVPVFIRSLKALDAILDKAAAYCEAKRVDPAVLCATRLIPDMLPLTRQVLIACDTAKNGTSRISGIAAPTFEDTEKTIVELKARIAKTLDFLGTVDEAAVDAAPGRIIEFPVGPNRMKMEAVAYLLHWVLPNFHFHVVTAYDILRASGLDIGKRDYFGDVPGMLPV
ncbi:MAG: DUF1993 domain-containing protein [Ancalomicrobiaceae bacterium]|nr:DUF1993 domain-containing protein [Ancalomicrobiaceae bacterium]